MKITAETCTVEAMRGLRRPARADVIARRAGYTVRATRLALRSLASRGLVERVGVRAPALWALWWTP